MYWISTLRTLKVLVLREVVLATPVALRFAGALASLGRLEVGLPGEALGQEGVAAAALDRLAKLTQVGAGGGGWGWGWGWGWGETP
jgi:hypothetical protein